MKNLYYCTKKNVYLITKNDDGTLTFTPEAKNAGAMIMQRGGISAFLEHCIEDERDFKEFVEDRELVAKKQKEYREAMRLQSANTEKESVVKAYNEMLSKYGMSIGNIDKSVAIEASVDNLYVLMRYLRSIPWGQWHLPTLSQGYSANQYDCDGKIAVTVILNDGITTEDGKVVKKLQYGAPMGHLSNYTNIGRL